MKHAASVGAILLACAILFSAFPARADDTACGNPALTKQYGIDFIKAEPGVEGTEVGEASMAQSLYATYQKIAGRAVEAIYMDQIASALVVSMTQFGYYGIVFYNASDCEIGHISPLNKGQIDEILKAWAAGAGEEA